MSNNPQTGQMTYRTLLHNTLITGLIATCAVVAINATYIILFLYFREQIYGTTYGHIFEGIITFIDNNYLLITIFILGLCAPFIARIYPHDPILRRISWISGTALLTLPQILFFVFISLWPSGPSDIIGTLWYLLYIFPLTLLYLFLLACALGETLYIERNPHVLAMWEGWDLRNITTLMLFPYYTFIALHMLILFIFFVTR